MADIHPFPGDTVADWPVDVALDKAKNWGMERCVIVGLDADGRLRFGGSTSDAGWMVVVLEATRLDLVRGAIKD